AKERRQVGHRAVSQLKMADGCIASLASDLNRFPQINGRETFKKLICTVFLKVRLVFSMAAWPNPKISHLCCWQIAEKDADQSAKRRIIAFHHTVVWRVHAIKMG